MRYIILCLLLCSVYGMEIVTMPGDGKYKCGLVIFGTKGNEVVLESHIRIEDVVKEYKGLIDSSKITNVVVFRLKSGLKGIDCVPLAAKVMEEIDKVTASYPCLDDPDETKRENFNGAVVQIYVMKRK